jgi:hypothetical protein
MKTLFSWIGFGITIVAALLKIKTDSDKVPSMYLWIAIAISGCLSVVGLLAEYKPWKWRLPFGRQKPQSTIPVTVPEQGMVDSPPKPGRYIDNNYQPLCPEKECFHPLVTQKHGPGYALREAIIDQPDWSAIEDLACRAFGHSSFTEATLDRLESWLNRIATHRKFVGSIPTAEVIRLLQEEVVRISLTGPAAGASPKGR